MAFNIHYHHNNYFYIYFLIFFWKRSISFATTPLNASRHIRFGIAISALAISENFHAISRVVVAPMYAISEKNIR